MIVDTFLVYQFIKKLITPFDQTQAFERGLIDQNGNFLKKRKYFSPDDKRALGKQGELNKIITNNNGATTIIMEGDTSNIKTTVEVDDDFIDDI